MSSTHTPLFLPPLPTCTCEVTYAFTYHTHTHTSRKFHIHSWHCCPQKSCFHSNKSLLLQVPYLWAPSHKLCSSQSEQTEQRTDPVINHTTFDLASYHLSVVLHVAITITWPSHDHHMTITWLSHDYHLTMYVCMYKPCIYSVCVFAQYKCMLTLHVGRQSENGRKRNWLWIHSHKHRIRGK